MLNNFDEINMRSLPIEQYFGEMGISKEQKKKRIELAEDLEDEILFVLSLVAVMNDYASVDWSNIEQQFENAFRSSLKGKYKADNWLDTFIKDMSKNLAESTRNNVGDEYNTSYDRARLIAENEANEIYNHIDNEEALLNGCTQKTWNTMLDKRVRHTHRLVDNQTIDIDDLFKVGGDYMAYPTDRTYGASTREIINCRCFLTYK